MIYWFEELEVAIPKMVRARASGIPFTVDPVTAEDSKILLEANRGPGEGVVSGAESVDGFVADKKSLEIVARHIGNNVKCLVCTKDGADSQRRAGIGLSSISGRIAS